MTVRPLHTELRRWLAVQPGRCCGCGMHLASMPHAEHCPLGPRAIVTVRPDGKPVLRPTPLPTSAEKAAARRVGDRRVGRDQAGRRRRTA